jgi:hypothetical protein
MCKICAVVMMYKFHQYLADAILKCKGSSLVSQKCVGMGECGGGAG